MRKSFLAILSFLFLFACSASDTETIPAGFKGSFVDIMGQQIRVYQTGKGPDLLLIHGLPGCIEDWETILPELSKRYRVTAFDRPGHGFSSEKKLKYNIAQNVDLTVELIYKLRLRKPVVVGHSYGGSTVVALAERNPINIKAFVAVSPVAEPRGKAEMLFYILKTPVIGPAAAKLVKLFTGCSMIEEGLNEAFNPNQKDMPGGFADIRCRIFSQPKVIRTLSEEEVAMMPDVKNMMKHYDKINKPMFIVHGKNDLVVPVSDAVFLNKAVRRSKLILLENTGHMVQYARPAELIRVIDEASGF